MIIVKIELYPSNGSQMVELGRLHICNDATGSKEIGNYITKLMRKGTTDRIQKTGSVMGHRRGNYPIWVLVARAIKSIISEPVYRQVDNQTPSQEPDET